MPYLCKPINPELSLSSVAPVFYENEDPSVEYAEALEEHKQESRSASKFVPVMLWSRKPTALRILSEAARGVSSVERATSLLRSVEQSGTVRNLSKLPEGVSFRHHMEWFAQRPTADNLEQIFLCEGDLYGAFLREGRPHLRFNLAVALCVYYTVLGRGRQVMELMSLLHRVGVVMSCGVGTDSTTQPAIRLGLTVRHVEVCWNRALNCILAIRTSFGALCYSGYPDCFPVYDEKGTRVAGAVDRTVLRSATWTRVCEELSVYDSPSPIGEGLDAETRHSMEVIEMQSWYTAREWYTTMYKIKAMPMDKLTPAFFQHVDKSRGELIAGLRKVVEENGLSVEDADRVYLASSVSCTCT